MAFHFVAYSYITLMITIVDGNVLNNFFNESTLLPFKEYVVGGYLIDIKDAPYQVSLRYHGLHRCGGTLIAKQWVLTAAHCECPNSAYIGSSNKISGGINVDIIRVYPHPMYDCSMIDYDFSLIKLANYKTSGLTIGYATLPKQNEEMKDGTILRVSGWGITYCPVDDINLLRAVKIPKVSQRICKNTYNIMITDRMFCAGYKDGEKDSCQGDSGGPLVHGNKIVGIVSWGKICGAPNAYGVYSKVSYIRDWIQEITGT